MPKIPNPNPPLGNEPDPKRVKKSNSENKDSSSSSEDKDFFSSVLSMANDPLRIEKFLKDYLSATKDTASRQAVKCALGLGAVESRELNAAAFATKYYDLFYSIAPKVLKKLTTVGGLFKFNKRYEAVLEREINKFYTICMETAPKSPEKRCLSRALSHLAFNWSGENIAHKFQKKLVPANEKCPVLEGTCSFNSSNRSPILFDCCGVYICKACVKNLCAGGYFKCPYCKRMMSVAPNPSLLNEFDAVRKFAKPMLDCLDITKFPPDDPRSFKKRKAMLISKPFSVEMRSFAKTLIGLNTMYNMRPITRINNAVLRFVYMLEFSKKTIRQPSDSNFCDKMRRKLAWDLMEQVQIVICGTTYALVTEYVKSSFDFI